jgi:hypothetical protein
MTLDLAEYSVKFYVLFFWNLNLNSVVAIQINLDSLLNVELHQASHTLPEKL